MRTCLRSSRSVTVITGLLKKKHKDFSDMLTDLQFFSIPSQLSTRKLCPFTSSTSAT